MAVGVEPTYETWSGPVGTEVAFVLSLNLHRRNLDESQRATVATELATLPHGVRSDAEISASITQENAAGMLNVSRASVQFARRVKENGTTPFGMGGGMID